MSTFLDFKNYNMFFLFAITIGSFLNVCIYRIPRGEDIVHTNSHCMNCGSWRGTT